MEIEQLFPLGIFWFDAKGLVKEINGPKTSRFALMQ